MVIVVGNCDVFLVMGVYLQVVLVCVVGNFVFFYFCCCVCQCLVYLGCYLWLVEGDVLWCIQGMLCIEWFFLCVVEFGEVLYEVLEVDEVVVVVEVGVMVLLCQGCVGMGKGIFVLVVVVQVEQVWQYLVGVEDMVGGDYFFECFCFQWLFVLQLVQGVVCLWIDGFFLVDQG